jgi:uncharacterized protein (TIGR02300 family)
LGTRAPGPVGPTPPLKVLLVAKPELGSKHKCQNCGTKFFDLNKDPIVCPKCGEVQASSGPAARGPVREAAANDDDEPDTEAGPEVLSLDDADQVEDGKVAVAGVEDEVEVEEDEASSDDDDTFLEEDEDDGDDVSDLIDSDIEDDEER